jgi:hypothetical protein
VDWASFFCWIKQKTPTSSVFDAVVLADVQAKLTVGVALGLPLTKFLCCERTSGAYLGPLVRFRFC